MSTKNTDRPKTPTGRAKSPIKININPNQTAKSTFKKFDLNFEPNLKNDTILNKLIKKSDP